MIKIVHAVCQSECTSTISVKQSIGVVNASRCTQHHLHVLQGRLMARISNESQGHADDIMNKLIRSTMITAEQSRLTREHLQSLQDGLQRPPSAAKQAPATPAHLLGPERGGPHRLDPEWGSVAPATTQPTQAPSAAADTTAAKAHPKPSAEPPAPERDMLHKKQTLGMHLSALQQEDPKCVFIARRINGMGFKSQEILTAHYSQYGEVSKVLVAHSQVKPYRNKGVEARIRPGSLGFIVMGSAGAVERILEDGHEQNVSGWRICVEPFEQTAQHMECQEASATDSTSLQHSATSTTAGSRSGSSNSSHDHDNGNDKAEPSTSPEGGSSDTQADCSDSGSGTDGSVPSPVAEVGTR